VEPKTVFQYDKAKHRRIKTCVSGSQESKTGLNVNGQQRYGIKGK